MTTEELSRKAFHHVWSGLNYPSELNHSGKQIFELLKYNAMSAYSQEIFSDLEKTRNFTLANSMITEIENLITGNYELGNQIQNIISNGKNDKLISMPKINTTPDDIPSETYQEEEGLSAWGIVKLVLGIISFLISLAQLFS